MNRRFYILFGLVVTILLTISIPAENVNKTKIVDDDRSYFITTSGTTTPMNVFPGCGWVCFFQMISPFPDQMYFSLGGIINYENGSTTIMNDGDESIVDGPHKVIFFNFYGPISTFDKYTVSLEGNAVFAMVLRGW